MAQEIVRDRTLIQGVSQQAEDLRRPGQTTSSENCWLSPVEGAGKRPGTRHLAKLADVPYTDALTHAIDRDRDEKYGLLVGHETLVVADELGNTHSVISHDNLVGRPEDASDFTNGSLWVEPTVTTSGMPRHVKNAHSDPDGGMNADLISWENASTNNYIELSLDDELFLTSTPFLFVLRMKDKDSSLGIVYIQWTDGAGNHNYASFDLSTGTMEGDSGADPTRTKITALDDGWYKLEILFQHGTVTPATTTDIKLYPSGEIAAGPGPGPTNVGSGGVYFYKLEIIDLSVADLSYLSCEKPQLLTFNKHFGTDWTTSQAALPVDTTDPGPYGSDSYQVLQRTIGGTLGTITQAQGIFFAGPQLLSCFCRNYYGAAKAEGIRLRFRDTTGGTTDHDVLFEWDGNGVPVLLETRQDILDYGAVDLGHGNYRIWATFDPAFSTNTAAGDPRQVAIGVDDSDSLSNKYVEIWGATLVEGVSHIKDAPFVDPNESLSVVTVQDSTFIANSEVLPAMTTSKAAGDDMPETEAFVFIQQAAYETQYQVSVIYGDTVAVEYAQVAQTAATGGGTVSEGQYDTWHVEMTNRGTTGPGWDITVNGFSATFNSSVLNDGVTNDVHYTCRRGAAALNKVIAANNIPASASSRGNVIIVRATDNATAITVAVAGSPASGAATATKVIDRTTSEDAIERADTAIIAEALAAKLDDYSGLEVEANNSVIYIRVTDGQPISELEVKDAVGNTYMKRIWKSVDFFDELPTTCKDGTKIRVAGDADENLDDYYVVFDADKAGAFGKGVWRETVQTGTLDEFDGATMPHRLVRRQDNDVGTYTDVPYSVYFSWEEVQWTKQMVGSPDLVPQPSFIGKPITGVFYWKDRLGFLSNQNVIMSEASRFENFWRTTVRTLVDSDPLDASAGTKDVTNFKHAELTDQRIFLFSELSVFEVLGTPLTPRTVEIRKRLDERNSRRCSPASIGRSVLFAYKNSQFTNLKEIVQVGDDLFDAPGISDVVPKFIPGDPVFLRVSSVENLALVLADGDRSTLYVYKFFYSGEQKAQSAWGTWTFGEDTRILGAVFIQSRILLYLERDDGVFLESMDIGDGLVDEGGTFRAHIDRGINSRHPQVTSVFAAGDTTFTLPYVMDAAEAYQAWTDVGDSAGQGMRIASTTTPTTTTIVLPGADYTERNLIFGQQFTSSIELSKPLRKDQGPDQQAVYLEGRVHAQRTKVAYEGAGRFQILTTPGARSTQTTTNTAGENTGSGLTLASGAEDFPTRENARDLVVKLQNDQATPANFLSVEHIVEHQPRA